MPKHDAEDLLARARKRYTQKAIAQQLGVDARTVRRWELKESEPSPYVAEAIRTRLLSQPEATPKQVKRFTFIDLFAGIGGTRLGFEARGGRCVYTCEWNKFSRITYEANFGSDPEHRFDTDITEVDAAEIPDHDILVAGFPCQPFSIAGVSKKRALGMPDGFECKTQGTLFFDVARIIKAKRPKAFLLENVKNLLSHDKGNTFRVIADALEEELGYTIQYRIIDGAHFVPQHRERIIIVGFRDATEFSWNGLKVPRSRPKLSAILHPENGSERPEKPYTEGPKARVNPKYTLTDHLWKYLQAYAAKHRAAGNGFGFGLVSGNDVARTLSARYYKDGSEILVSRGNKGNPRRLTPRECARLMGFPDSFEIPVSDTQAYKQFGNSVVVPVISEVARIMVPHVLKKATAQKTRIYQDELLRV